MATPNKTTSTSSALWVIALSLTVIAACLVVLVTRQERQREAERVEAERFSAQAAAPVNERRLPKSFVVSPGKRGTPEESAAAVESVPELEHIPQPEPTGVPPMAIEPKVSSGLAPLTYLAATNSPAAPGLIKGRVTLKGTPPPENVIIYDPQCGQLHKGATNTTRFYVVSKDGGLADVFVYINGGLKGQKFPAPSTPVVVNQKGCFFEPYVFGVMTGQKLVVKNSDPILHDFHSMPQMRGNEVFNLALKPRAVITKTFQTPEIPLRINCGIHPWMYAYACVVDNPFFAMTDAHGNFVITNVPPGDYTLTAFHRKTHGARLGETQDITVAAGETTTANFTIQAPLPDNRIARQK